MLVIIVLNQQFFKEIVKQIIPFVQFSSTMKKVSSHLNHGVNILIDIQKPYKYLILHKKSTIHCYTKRALLTHTKCTNVCNTKTISLVTILKDITDYYTNGTLVCYAKLIVLVTIQKGHN